MSEGDHYLLCYISIYCRTEYIASHEPDGRVYPILSSSIKYLEDSRPNGLRPKGYQAHLGDLEPGHVYLGNCVNAHASWQFGNISWIHTDGVYISPR